MNLGSGVAMQSLYMLRDNSGAGQLTHDRRQPPHFTHADLQAIAQPTTPGWPHRWRAFAGRRAPSPAGIFHIGNLGETPRMRGLEAGALNVNAFAAVAPASALAGIGGPVGGGQYPSFGPVNPNAQPAPGQADGQPVQGPARVIGYVQPPGSALTPPIGFTPAPGGPSVAPPTTPPSSNLTPWLVGGGLVLALMFLGTQDKKRRRR